MKTADDLALKESAVVGPELVKLTLYGASTELVDGKEGEVVPARSMLASTEEVARTEDEGVGVVMAVEET